MTRSPVHVLAASACNRALALDPERDTILAALSGRRIGVHVSGAPALDITVGFEAAGVTIAPGVDEAAADAVVSGTPAALLSLMSGGTAMPATDGVRVRGDLGLLQEVGVALSRLRPDWQEPLARILGDELGHPLARGLERGFGLLLRTARELREDTAEFLREESGLLATAEEVREFADEVDRLRDAVQRLERRIALLRSAP